MTLDNEESIPYILSQKTTPDSSAGGRHGRRAWKDRKEVAGSAPNAQLLLPGGLHPHPPRARFCASGYFFLVLYSRRATDGRGAWGTPRRSGDIVACDGSGEDPAGVEQGRSIAGCGGVPSRRFLRIVTPAASPVDRGGRHPTGRRMHRERRKRPVKSSGRRTE
jgi:hypothetical protein